MAKLPQRHIMLDLETLATTQDATIVTIGAVPFDPMTGEVFEDEGIYLRVNVDGQRRNVDPNTMVWWMHQSDDARLDTFSEEDRVPLEIALGRFAQWCHDQEVTGDLDENGDEERKAKLVLWSNGPTFDEMILRHAYQQNGGGFPFHYAASRCFRTVRQFAQDAGAKKPARHGVHHNALHDAVFQARGVCLAYDHLGIRPSPAPALEALEPLPPMPPVQD